MASRIATFGIGLLGTVLVAPVVTAQGRGTFLTPPARTAGNSLNVPARNHFNHAPGARFSGRLGRPIRHRHLVAYPYGYAGYWPYDSGYDDGPVEEPPAPSRPNAPASPPEIHKAADSVVIELRGDRWVRLTATGPVEVAPEASALSSRAVVLPAFDQAPAAAALPAAILVFRDGHQEEAARYTIVGNTLYLKTDYYVTGTWGRKISVSDLDIAATRKLNSERGTKFTLPSRSSEVILRP